MPRVFYFHFKQVCTVGVKNDDGFLKASIAIVNENDRFCKAIGRSIVNGRLEKEDRHPENVILATDISCLVSGILATLRHTKRTSKNPLYRELVGEVEKQIPAVLEKNLTCKPNITWE